MNRVEAMIQSKGRKPLIGVAAYTFNSAFVEMAGLLGFDIIWIEMEHAHIAFSEAADLCRIGAGLGMLTMIRLPDAQRQTVLRAAECGADILDLPMGSTPEVVAELVRHARYYPEGSRGFFGASRGTRYGMFGHIADEQRRVNENICLMAQIETAEAAARAEEICSVPGLDAIFVGMGDLSASMGIPGQINHPDVRGTTDRVIEVAKAHGKLVGMPGLATDFADWAAKGVDMLFCGSDISCMRTSLQTLLKQVAGEA
jgi:2-keto-3-deoxy-L-rhamnonate aldolase RhmA